MIPQKPVIVIDDEAQDLHQARSMSDWSKIFFCMTCDAKPTLLNRLKETPCCEIPICTQCKNKYILKCPYCHEEISDPEFPDSYFYVCNDFAKEIEKQMENQESPDFVYHFLKSYDIEKTPQLKTKLLISQNPNPSALKQSKVLISGASQIKPVSVHLNKKRKLNGPPGLEMPVPLAMHGMKPAKPGENFSQASDKTMPWPVTSLDSSAVDSILQKERKAPAAHNFNTNLKKERQERTRGGRSKDRRRSRSRAGRGRRRSRTPPRRSRTPSRRGRRSSRSPRRKPPTKRRGGASIPSRRKH